MGIVLTEMELILEHTQQGISHEVSATNFGLKNDMIQQVQNSCPFHGLLGDDANKHLDKFLHVTQSIKVNGVADDALRLYLFPHSLTHHATACFDRLPRNSINNFEQMTKMFLGTFMKRRPEECYDLIVNMTTHYNDWDTLAQWSKSSSSIISYFDIEIAALKAEMVEINKNLMSSSDDILKNMQTYITSLKNSNLDLKNMFGQFMKMNTASSSGSETLPGNTITNPNEVLKGITTRSGTAYQGPTIPTTYSSLPPIVERETEVTKDMVHPTNNGSIKDVQLLVVSTESLILNSKPVISPIIELIASPVGASKPNQRPSIPYPSRLHDQKLHDKANDQREKFFQIFKNLNFNISFVDALILMPKFGPTIKTLLTNKDKLCELVRTPLNEHCSTVLLKKLPEKLGDPGQFLIPCDFHRMAECLALADLGASINLMPLSMWNKLYLPDLSPTCMTLELADRSISRPVRVAKDVFVKVGELILRVGKEAITFNLDQTSRYSATYNDMTTNRIDVIDMDCEEYSQEVLGFSDVIASGNPTPNYDLIVSTTSLTLTSFRNSDFLLEEVDAFLAHEDDLTSPEVDQSYVDTEGDILLLEAFLNDDPSLPPPNEGNYFPEDLPPHLEYAFLEGDDKFPVIIAKYLSVEEKTALITVLKSHKRAIAWKLSDIKGIDPEFCTHKILMEEDLEPAVQHQRRVNPKIHDVIKNEVLKLLDARLIYRSLIVLGKLTEAPILIVPDWDMPFELMCDASDFAISVVMGQRQENHFRPIHYASKTMTEAKSNYIITEKEMLAVVYAFEKFLSYLIINKCIMYTNHFALKYLFAKKDSKARLLRQSSEGVYTARKPLTFSRLATMDPSGDIMAQTTQPRRFGTPRAIISNRGTHFYNDQFAKVMMKFSVTHHLATPHRPQTSGQVEVSNRGLKRILERTVGENRASWSDKLDDAL
nr:reverse transcriptase domain-containing protein [Tanacetum cinerariifolium]